MLRYRLWGSRSGGDECGWKQSNPLEGASRPCAGAGLPSWSYAVDP